MRVLQAAKHKALEQIIRSDLITGAFSLIPFNFPLGLYPRFLLSTERALSRMANDVPNTLPSSSGASAPEIGQSAKPGRPNKWTASRDRKLARLYLYSNLPQQDIAKALRDQDGWQPGLVVSTLSHDLD